MNRETYRALIGPEVEGYLKHSGPTTLVVRLPVAVEILDRVEHIFLHEEFDSWDWLREALHRKRVPVTAAVDLTARHKTAFLRREWPEIRLMLRVWMDCPFEELAPSDEISIGTPFNLLTFKVGDGVRTVPSDYEGDRECT